MSIGAIAAAHGAVAQEPPKSSFERLIACRALTDDAARLACFDQAASALSEAVRRKDVTVVDRQDVRAAKRSLFGITLPDLRLFGDKDDVEPVQEITSTLRSVQPAGPGRYAFTLAEGGVWQTTETSRLAPEKGDSVVIRRAALGSYLAKFGKARSVRVERLR